VNNRELAQKFGQLSTPLIADAALRLRYSGRPNESKLMESKAARLCASSSTFPIT
jgi:hypothetical protein